MRCLRYCLLQGPGKRESGERNMPKECILELFIFFSIVSFKCYLLGGFPSAAYQLFDLGQVS